MKECENGRSLVEMLGTLTVIGVLTITAIVGFRYAMNKLHANRIYQDVTMAYVAVNTLQNAPYHWEKTGVTPESGYNLLVRRDKVDNDFVLVKEVEGDICDLFLDLAEDGDEMMLYYTDNRPMDCGDDVQDIVVSFSGVPPLIPCDENGVSDCPEKYNSYCSSEGDVCLQCTLGQRANEAGDACVDLCADREDNNTLSCISEAEGINWCCPTDGICSDVIGECISNEDACVYDLTMSGYQADCSATLVVSGYQADCSGSLTITTAADGTQTASMSVSGCKPGEYCIFAWSEQSWGLDDAEPKLQAGETKNFFGQCHSLLSTSGATAAATASMSVSGCKPGEYCIFAWSEQSWGLDDAEPKLQAGETKNFFGQCHSLLSTSSATAASTASLIPVKECADSDKYCDIRWSDSECKNTLKSDHTERFYGACAEWTTTNATCPINEKGIIVE